MLVGHYYVRLAVLVGHYYVRQFALKIFQGGSKDSPDPPHHLFARLLTSVNFNCTAVGAVLKAFGSLAKVCALRVC